jgi:hypothetical protein
VKVNGDLGFDVRVNNLRQQRGGICNYEHRDQTEWERGAKLFIKGKRELAMTLKCDLVLRLKSQGQQPGNIRNAYVKKRNELA